MKKICVYVSILVVLFSACATGGKTAEMKPLNQAIKEAAEDIENSLEPKVKIALLNFTANSDAFSEYVLDELSAYLVNGKKLVVVDRRELDLIRKEEQYQLSGEVSDESAQAIGKKLGAQVIVSGSLNTVGRVYRLRIRTLVVETAVIASTSTTDISPNEARVVSLLLGVKPQEDPLPEGLFYETIGKTITITGYANQSITDLRIPSSIDGLPVTAIGEKAFTGAYYLTNITIPPTVITIGEQAFYACFELTSITIPTSVTTIGAMAFYSCFSLTSVTISASVTSIGEMAFEGCIDLTNINVDTRNRMYSSVDGVLFDKSGKTLLQFPKGRSGYYPVPIPVTTIVDKAFEDCKKLTEISMLYVTAIGDKAFNGCTGLTSVSLSPDSSVKALTIGYNAFQGCTGIKNIIIPRSVTSIETWAFDGWTASQTITVEGHANQGSADSAWHGWRSSCNATIVYQGK